MVQTMTRRIFPIDDWAPAQEAIYDEPAKVEAETHDFDLAQELPSTSSDQNQARLRGVSLSFPWRHRPKSSIFGAEELTTRFPDLALHESRSNGDGKGKTLQRRLSRTGGDRVQAGPRGKRHFKGMIRQASVSIKGFIPKRSSVQASSSEQNSSRRFLRSAHAPSQSLSASTTLDPSTLRPTTAHSPWRRLRQATSFRQSRVIYSGYPSLETINSPSDGEFTVPSVPMPGPGNGPPIIPPNTGGAARAAAAAFQSEVLNRKWFYPDDYQNDHESGIGIAVTSTESDLADTLDTDLDLDGLEADYEQLGISKVDFISQLPAELAITILAHLDASGLAAAARVSRGWNLVVRNQHVWRESFLREKTNTYATSIPVHPGTGRGVPAVRPDNDWKEIYRVKQALDRRWKEGKARPVYLNGHSDSIYCLQFDESKIITGSRDKTIRIWDMHTLACRLVIGPPEVIHDPHLLYDEDGRPTHFSTSESNRRGASSMPAAVSFPTHHKASILCLQYDDRMLVTGSSDASCIVYNVRSGYRPVRRLRHHSAAVLDLCFDERFIVTCSKDISICVWDRATGVLVKQLRGHSGPVNAVQMRGNTIVSCSGDFRVKLWNVETGRAIRELSGHNKGLACSQFSEDGRFVASAGNDRVIRIWDANTGECVREMKAHENLVRSLHIDSVSGRLVSGSYDTDIKVFDMETGRQLLDFPRWHASWVLSAKSDYRRIVSTGQDPKILVMDFGAGVKGIEMLEDRGQRRTATAAAGYI